MRTRMRVKHSKKFLSFGRKNPEAKYCSPRLSGESRNTCGFELKSSKSTSLR